MIHKQNFINIYYIIIAEFLKVSKLSKLIHICKQIILKKECAYNI